VRKIIDMRRAVSPLRKVRNSSLSLQKRIRDAVRRNGKARLKRLLQERARLSAHGLSTRRIDRDIRLLEGDMKDESLYAVASLYLTPWKTLKRAARISSARRTRPALSDKD
jgi:hypothetical protein